MKRINHAMAMVLVGIAGLALFTGCGQQRALTIKVIIDGSDVIKVSGNKLWIEHEQFLRPQRILLNGKLWIPQWTTNVSAPYEGLRRPSHRRTPGKLKCQKRPDAGPSRSRRCPPPKTMRRCPSGLMTAPSRVPIVIPSGLPGETTPFLVAAGVAGLSS